MRELAVDFGTSNTVAAVRAQNTGAVQLLQVDGWPVLPSAVWLAPDGTLVVGRDAERQARLDPARYEPNPKRRVDEVEVLLGDTVVAVVDLIAAVLRRVLDEATRQLGGPPDRVVLTHPAGWGAIRVSTLAAAARRAGVGGTVQLLPEPVAAAAHFAGLPGHSIDTPPHGTGAYRDSGLGNAPHGDALAVYDLGGGTVDCAVLARTPDGWQVLAEAGLGDVGGRDLDQALLEHVGREIGPAHPEEWAALARPHDAASRRAARALADDVRAAKEALSRYPQADVPLPPPLPDAHVTRAELEGLVRPRLERTAALAASTIAVAGLRPDQLTGVYLVGGGSRMPLVAQLLTERLGVLPVAVESPESSVVLGALVAPVPHELTDPRSPDAVFAPLGTGPDAYAPPPGPGDAHAATGPFATRAPVRPTLPTPVPAGLHGGALGSAHTGPHGPYSGPPGASGDPSSRDASPRPRRRPLTIALVAAGLVVVLGGAALAATQLGDRSDGSPSAASSTTGAPATTDDEPTGDSTEPTGPTTTADTGSPLPNGAVPPEPVEVDAAAKDAPFRGDTELRAFAGPAVDRALNCVDPGGAARATFQLRTQVQCVYRVGDALVYATFVAGASPVSCSQFALTLSLAGADVETGSWTGGQYEGTWRDATMSTGGINHLTFYEDSGGELCGFVEGQEGRSLPLQQIHAHWDTVVRPGS